MKSHVFPFHSFLKQYYLNLKQTDFSNQWVKWTSESARFVMRSWASRWRVSWARYCWSKMAIVSENFSLFLCVYFSLHRENRRSFHYCPLFWLRHILLIGVLSFTSEKHESFNCRTRRNKGYSFVRWIMHMMSLQVIVPIPHLSDTHIITAAW